MRCVLCDVNRMFVCAVCVWVVRCNVVQDGFPVMCVYCVIGVSPHGAASTCFSSYNVWLHCHNGSIHYLVKCVREPGQLA